jgi:hypothetical protein
VFSAQYIFVLSLQLAAIIFLSSLLDVWGAEKGLNIITLNKRDFSSTSFPIHSLSVNNITV